ncbi:unnamed protein product [Rotaria sordida]|uniref:Uncharacterized protein n=1 Tax=Rotaria sordida TaxID=392033 RepID=A0A813NCW4_9BILA|nr:unnamed protein product [Rotaria sordida]CAF0752947.1 unnamed protein product [Rotaria sordida]
MSRILIFYFLAYDDINGDADLMADPLLDPNMRTLSLEDIKLINERDNPSVADYVVLALTPDTHEKDTDKRLICVTIIERLGGMKCICDIIFLYRSKGPPQFYTSTGDINGLQMCVKEGFIPLLRVPPPVLQTQSNLYPHSLSHHAYQTSP